MRWQPAANNKLTARYPDVIPRRRLVWRWWKCLPLVALGTVAVVVVLATMLKAWLLSMTPKEVWMDLYYILSLGR